MEASPHHRHLVVAFPSSPRLQRCCPPRPSIEETSLRLQAPRGSLPARLGPGGAVQPSPDAGCPACFGETWVTSVVHR